MEDELLMDTCQCSSILVTSGNDGKQPKTFGLNFFNFTIFNFFNFCSLVYEIHFIERTLWTCFVLLTDTKCGWFPGCYGQRAWNRNVTGEIKHT